LPSNWPSAIGAHRQDETTKLERAKLGLNDFQRGLAHYFRRTVQRLSDRERRR
jgi:hypothetical protein